MPPDRWTKLRYGASILSRSITKKRRVSPLFRRPHVKKFLLLLLIVFVVVVGTIWIVTDLNDNMLMPSSSDAMNMRMQP